MVRIYKLYGIEYNYSPGMDLEDFVRNNNVDEKTIDEVKEIMKNLYGLFIDENF